MTTSNSNSRTANRLTELSDLERLWLAEFGQPVELIVRIAMIALGALALWFYEGSVLGPMWALAYLSLLALCALTLAPAKPHAPGAWLAALASHSALSLTFAALPIYLISSADPVLIFFGVLAIASLAIFTFHREEPPAFIQPLDIGIIWIALLVAWMAHIPADLSVLAKVTVTLPCLVAGGYYTSALITTRAARAELRRTALAQQQAQRMEAIGKLSGGIAHDFNNILTALQGSLELYHEVPQGHERDALVEEAREASARASAVVSQLLSFAGRAKLTPQPLDANQMVEEVAAAARAMLPDGIALEIRLASEPVKVLADPTLLAAAMNNLVANAREALGKPNTPGAQGTITVAVDIAKGPARKGCSAPAEEVSGAHLRFSVADDGPGMDQDVCARAVEPFYSTKPAGQGSGLGLSMALGFAQQSGGTLKIKTDTAGTTAALHLPLASDQAG